MLGELRRNRIAGLLAGASVVALSFGAIIIAPSGARAESNEFDTGTALTTGNSYAETDSDAAGASAGTLGGTTDITLGTTGDTTADALDNQGTDDITITDNMTDGDVNVDGRIVTASTGTITLNLGVGDHTDNAQTFTFSDDIVESTGAITLNTTDTTSADAIEFAFDSGSGALSIDAAITDSATGDTLEVSTTGANLVTFNDAISVTTLDLDADTTFSSGTVATTAGTGGIDIAGVTATFSGGAVSSADNFTVAASGNVTANTTAATSFTVTDTVAISGGSNTLTLGANIDSGDTIFSVGTFTGDGAGGITVVVDQGLASGTVTLETGDAADNSDDFAAVANTVLATHAIADSAGDTVLTSTSKTAATIATEQGISEDYANAGLQAAASLEGAGTVAEKAAFNTALGTGGTTTSNAIASAGAQSDIIGGGAQNAASTNMAVQGVVGSRLGALRAGSGAAYAGSGSGFSAGGHTATSGSVWIRGFGGYADADTDSDNIGFEADYGGIVLGADYNYNAKTVLGMFASFAVGSVDGDGAGNAQLDSDSYQIGFYYGRTEAKYYINANVDYTYVDNDASRTVTANSSTASAEYGAHVFAGGVEVGAPMEVHSNLFFTPVVGLAVTHYDAEEYTETGAGAFNQTVDSDGVTQVVGKVGLRAHYVHKLDGLSLVPEVSVAAGYDFANDGSNAVVTYTGGGSSYSVAGSDLGRYRTELGAGVTANFDDSNMSISLNYDGEIRSDYTNHGARIDLRIGF